MWPQADGTRRGGAWYRKTLLDISGDQSGRQLEAVHYELKEPEGSCNDWPLGTADERINMLAARIGAVAHTLIDTLNKKHTVAVMDGILGEKNNLAMRQEAEEAAAS